MRLNRLRAMTAAAALGLSMASLVPATAASAADDVVEFATTDGAPVKIVTTVAEQKAYVFFDVAAARHLTVSCTPGAGTPSSYVIRRADGSEFRKGPCDAGRSLNVDPIFESGRFRMLLTGDNGQPFSATVRVLMVEDATGTLTPGGAPLTLKTTNVEQNLSFAVPMRAGQRVQMMCQAWSTSEIMVDPRGKIVEKDFGSVGGCSGYSEMGDVGLYTATETGTYRFVLYPYSRGTNYSATVSAVSTLPDVTAELPTDGTPVTLATTAPYQRVRATISLKADTRLYITCEKKSDESTSAWLYGPRPYDYTLKRCQDGGPDTEPTSINGTLEAGVSTLLIDPYETNTDEFILRAYTVPAPVTADLPLDGTPVTLETTTPGQTAQFAVKAQGGERVWVGCRLGPRRTAKPWTNDDRASVGFTHPKPDIADSGDCNAPDDPASFYKYPAVFGSSSYTATMRKAGTHTLTVRMNTAETNTATLWAYRVPADVEATAAVGGDPVTVETTVPGQRAQVRFPGVEGSRYTVSCDVTGNRQEGEAALMSPAGKFVAFLYCDPTDTKTTVALTEPGDYRLQFNFKKDGIGKAVLKVASAS